MMNICICHGDVTINLLRNYFWGASRFDVKFQAVKLGQVERNFSWVVLGRTRRNFIEAPCFWGSMYGMFRRIIVDIPINIACLKPSIHREFGISIPDSKKLLSVQLGQSRFRLPTYYFFWENAFPPQVIRRIRNLANQLNWRISKLFRLEFISSLFGCTRWIFVFTINSKSFWWNTHPNIAHEKWWLKDDPASFWGPAYFQGKTRC